MSASSFDPTGPPKLPDRGRAGSGDHPPPTPRGAPGSGPSGESIPPQEASTDPGTPFDPAAEASAEAGASTEDGPAAFAERDPGVPPGATTRLAPSPTGPLHLGHARSFLAAWWFARAAGGRVLLRIEDLDSTRCRPEWTAAAVADLAWLGLDWDGPMRTQSDQLEPYREAVDRLLERGLAYPCTCTRREIEEAIDAPHASAGERRYPGTCRERWKTRAAAERATGRDAGVRFRVPPGPREIRDLLHGTVVADPDAECGDFIVLRRDGAVAYQLGVVVDDARQGVDLVVRGDDLLPSAVRQSLLQDALGLPHPAWLHVPLVLAPDGERLAKRRGARALAHLRADGVDPGRVVTWAARSLGLSGPADDPSAPADWLDAVRVGDLARAPVQIDSSRDLAASDGS